MAYMSVFRCSVFRLYANKLAEIIESIIEKMEKINDDENPEYKDYKQVLDGLKNKVQEIVDYAENECRDMELTELDNALFDVDSAIRALESFFRGKGESENEVAKLCSECLNVLQQMRDIVGREMAAQPTAPYPGILYLPARLEYAYSKLRDSLPRELTDKERMILRHLQESGKKKTLSELSRELRMDRSNLFRYLKSLVLKGLVVREYDRERRKIVYSARARKEKP